MENAFNINGSLSYKTNYFESFSEFIDVNNSINNKYVNIICCNIRSMNANFDELTLFLESDQNKNKIYVIVLTETWHDPLSQGAYVIEGYNHLFSTIKRNQNDGIFVFVRNNYITYFSNMNLLVPILLNSPLII